jgi:hypothetical protein
VLVAAAVCPHPPVLVPSLAAGAATELDDVRNRCREALSALAGTVPELTYVVGIDGTPRARSFLPWGVDERVEVPEPMPLSLLVGAWLTAGTLRSFVVVDDDMDAEDCAALGRELAGSADRVGMVVMGDGSPRHSEKAPGHLDPRAKGYDDEAAAAMRVADVETLGRLDPALARELMVAGRAPWQVLAGAASGRSWTAVSSLAVPYGVGYHVAAWT